MHPAQCVSLLLILKAAPGRGCMVRWDRETNEADKGREEWWNCHSLRCNNRWRTARYDILFHEHYKGSGELKRMLLHDQTYLEAHEFSFQSRVELYTLFIRQHNFL